MENCAVKDGMSLGPDENKLSGIFLNCKMAVATAGINIACAESAA